MTEIAQLVMRLRPAYRLEDVMRLTHCQILTLLTPTRSGGPGWVACDSVEEARALAAKYRAEQEDDDG